MHKQALLRASALALVLVGVGSFAGLAQEVDQATAPVPPAEILLLDQDRLFSDSAYGRAVGAVIDQLGRELSAQNRAIEAELMQEEQALTDARPTLSIEEFRARASAFDARVVEIRSAQDAKNRALGTYAEAARQRFLEIAGPILVDLVEASGANLLMDRRTVIFMSDDVDITQSAIGAIDAAIADRLDDILAQLPKPEL